VKYSWPLVGAGLTAEELAIAEIRAALPGVNLYDGQGRRDAILAEIVAALFNGTTLPFPTFSGDLTLPARLVYSPAVGKLVPGATSFSLRNTADNADNLLVTDAGGITVRNTISGITTLTATTLAGTLSTAAQPNITSVGTLTSLAVTGGATLRAGQNVGSTLFKTAQATNSPAGSPATIVSFSMAGGTLSSDGQTLRVRAYGTFANNANAKAVRLNINGALFTLNATTSAANNWWIDCDLSWRASGNSQQPFGGWIIQAPTTPTQFVVEGTNAMDLSLAQTVAIDCTQVAAADVILNKMTAELIP
jgi:hypothetical protein